MNKLLLRLTIPNIISNVSVPLLGITDIAILGHLGNVKLVGAMAIGTTIFNFIYWNLNFLRAGTSGFTAQAYGAGKFSEAADILVRSAGIALALALLLVAFQQPIKMVADHLVAASDDVKDYAFRYFFVRIWAMPATLALSSITGWFIGMQNAAAPMLITLFANVLNVVFSLLFVFVWDMDIAGVALGTVIAQYGGLGLALFFWHKKYRRHFTSVSLATVFNADKLRAFFLVNKDIFIRNLCLTSVFSFFPLAGARQSDTVLSVNLLLMQFFNIFSFVMDGFAFAGESLTGRFIGSGDSRSLRRMIGILFRWGAVMALLFTLIYAFGGKWMLWLFTDDQTLVEAARQYYFWVLAVPMAGFAAFLWDGVYIGATASKTMLHTMLIATALFFALYFSLRNVMFNNALWLSLIVFLSSRGIWQTLWAKKAVFKKNQWQKNQ
jgi:MATE family multidrug resistance protein